MSRKKLIEYLEGLEYPENWQRIAHTVRIRDNFTCQRCGRKDLPLHVHHINGRSNDISNLETLCRECHFSEHPWQRAAYEARGREDKSYLKFEWNPPEEFIELDNIQKELRTLRSRLLSVESKLDDGSYFLYPSPPPFFWRFIEKIKPRSFCSKCNRKDKLTKYKGGWMCKTCKEKEIQREKEEEKQKTQKEIKNLKQKIQKKQEEYQRKDDAAERKFVVSDHESIGLTELQRQLQLERQSR